MGKIESWAYAVIDLEFIGNCGLFKHIDRTNHSLNCVVFVANPACDVREGDHFPSDTSPQQT